MDWLAFLGSILGGLIGGLFTFFGVKLTIKNENEKANEKRKLEIIDKKPRLEIVDFKEIKPCNEQDVMDFSKCNVFFLGITPFEKNNKSKEIGFRYELDKFDYKKFDYIEYTFKNIGLTEINDIFISTNLPKNTCLLNGILIDSFIKQGILNYSVSYNGNYIKPGETLKIRFFYVRDQIIFSNIGGPTISLWMNDVNGNMWQQLLYAPTKEMEISTLTTYQDYLDFTNVDKALECFKKPYLW